MEILILGWTILMTTGSVVMLSLFASLQYLGTLLSPVIGSLADVLGRRAMQCWLRACYALLACVVMVAGFQDAVTPMLVFVAAFVGGLIRPADQVLRHSMIGDTMSADTLGTALGLARITIDSARIAGALAGAGLFATLGLGPAYVGVILFYIAGLLLTLGTTEVRPYDASTPFRIVREVRAGLAFTWRMPRIKALMLLAFLVNIFAFPMTFGFLPYAAREVFALDETGLGRMTAMFGLGSLLSALTFAATGGARSGGLSVVGYTIAWFFSVLAFGMAREAWQAYLLLALIGYTQGVSMLALSVLLIEDAGLLMRGRIMGVRMLAVYGLPIGMAAGGFLIEWLGFRTMVALYCAIGILLTLAIAFVWRRPLFRPDD